MNEERETAMGPELQLTDILSRTSPPEDARAIIEFEKMRFELSWRYFDFHARQRMQLFHFFIILTPFIFGGCFYLFKERGTVGYWPGQIATCAGALLAVLFFGLDRRNRQIIHLSERAIQLIESQFLFAYFRPITENGKPFQGVLTTEKSENRRRPLRRFRGHSFFIGSVYWIALLAFAALFTYFFVVQKDYVVLPAAVAR